MTKRATRTSTLYCLALCLLPQAVWADTLKVAASFSIIGDFVRRIADDDVEVNVIAPIGSDVHRWELTPPNVLALEDTDIVFYNGYDLEPWLRHVRAVIHDDTPLVALAERAHFAPIPVPTGEYEGQPDPHMWMDPQGAAAYLDVIADTLAGHAPDKAELYHRRAEEAREVLADLDRAIKERLDGIPYTNRTLITSEAGFGYFARAYEFEHTGIWGMNQETWGTARAMARMSERLSEQRPPALFYESTVAEIHMDALARETGLPLAGPLYLDTLSARDGPAFNYPALLRYNADLLHQALGGARSE